VALSVATTESPSQEEHFRGWGYPSEANGDAILGGHDSFVRSAVLERDTIAGVIQFDPNENLSVTFDALYIDFSEEKALRGVEEGGAQWGTGNYTVTDSNDGLVTAGYFDDFRSVIRNDGERKSGELMSGAVNVEWNLDDDWTLGFDASYGDVDKVITNIESYSGVGRAGLTTQGPATGRSWTMGSTGAIYGPHPSIAPVDLADFDTIRLAGPQAWGGGMGTVAQFQNAVAADGSVLQPDHAQDGFINEPRFDEELLSIKLDASRSLDGSFFTGVDFGVQYSDRRKSKDNGGFFLTAPTFPDDAPIPEEFRLGTADLSFLGVGSVVAYDGLAMFDSGFYIITDASTLDTDREGDSYTIEEEVTTAFVKADFDTNWGDVPVSGNFGLQYVLTDQTGFGSDAFFNPSGTVTATPTSDGDDYSMVLPSANVNFEVADGHFVRFAASKTMSRARIDELRPNNRVNFAFNLARVQSTDPLNSAWTGSAGNARLRPLEANQFDIAYDWYFADDGFVSAAFFYKDLVNWHRDASFVADFSQFYIPGFHEVVDPSDNSTVTPATFLGLVNFKEDGLKGDVSGIELQGNLPLGMFNPALEGFGVLAAAAFNDGDFEDGSSIPGLSEESYNLTLYFERGPFQARIAGTKRDQFSTEVRGLSLALVETVDQGAELLDAQIAYDFGLDRWTNWADGLTISLQAQNITDEDTTQANDVDA
ncbi:MAG: TonB-dependent receptor, partial [Gammaproteobacteria bacterium]|nr:TonB-dependent receptor [Gammaproteobacteria bacterium]